MNPDKLVSDLVRKGILLINVVNSGKYSAEVRHAAIERMRLNTLGFINDPNANGTKRVLKISKQSKEAEA